MDEALRERTLQALEEAKKIVVGQDQLLRAILAGLVCDGHLLIEGLPGLGKTLSVLTMSKLCDLGFQRIQFTPDLLPSDLIGTLIFSPQSEDFKVRFGPIFTQLLLADEINRSPAKVQAALLEAMEERQVTIGEKSYPLSRPFVVLATQNPIDQEGTYPLPEAQIDRFMMKINVDYPDFESEKKILDLDIQNYLENLQDPILSTDDFLQMKDEIQNVYVDEKLKDFIIKVVQSTRPGGTEFNKKYDGAIIAGASPRAGLWLKKLGQFEAYMKGDDYVSPEHLLNIIPKVLGHRILLSYEASLDDLSGQKIALEMANSMI